MMQGRMISIVISNFLQGLATFPPDSTRQHV